METKELTTVTSDILKDILKVENYQIGIYNLNTSTRELTEGENNIKLTKTEMYLLALFAANQRVVVTREYALKAIWGEDTFLNSRNMDVYICKIKKHLQQDKSIMLINIHGKGYRFIVG